MVKRLWSREELILGFRLYCEIPFGQYHSRNPRVIELAEIIGRTPSAAALKLCNFARLDPAHKKRGVGGAAHGSKKDIIVWDEFHNNWEKLAYESEVIKANLINHQMKIIDYEDLQQTEKFTPIEGTEKERKIRARINQHFFRKMILAAYENSCCITGLNMPELLTASHIVPWSVDKKNRLNPRNGLCLNAFHDRAFDRGYLTITPENTIKISKVVDYNEGSAARELLLKYNDRNVNLPHRFIPDPNFLLYHNNNIFKG